MPSSLEKRKREDIFTDKGKRMPAGRIHQDDNQPDRKHPVLLRQRLLETQSIIDRRFRRRLQCIFTTAGVHEQTKHHQANHRQRRQRQQRAKGTHRGRPDMRERGDNDGKHL